MGQITVDLQAQTMLSVDAATPIQSSNTASLYRPDPCPSVSIHNMLSSFTTYMYTHCTHRTEGMFFYAKNAPFYFAITL